MRKAEVELGASFEEHANQEVFNTKTSRDGTRGAGAAIYNVSDVSTCVLDGS